MKSPLPLLVAVVAVAVLAGCAQDNPVVIPEPEPSSAPIFESDEEALAAAEVAYGEYLKVSDAIYADGGLDAERIKAVASPDQAMLDMASFEKMARGGNRGTGATAFRSMTLQQFDPTSPDGLAIITVYACIDLSKTQTLDPAGKVISDNGGADLVPIQVEFDRRDLDTSIVVVASQGAWDGQNFCAP
ncbi:hypothetical protein EYE40_07740 [Glaciihabitans arcticus]|uniref:Lipoprotein n=1 Tax=Glaciihabitans arcticus TaxID=2668039 RepID=A0A4Q9GVS5_9MICO|nr:hypothetical protein [Glaciihabitans arcticus]TBN57297.1 hypothetical protein EYE40_07740 [Glaciihabitans arcticus]